MISGLAEVGQLSEAFGLFDSMILRGLSPSKIIYNALFDGCCKTGNLQKAQDLLQEMVQMGIASTKDFNTLIDGFLKNGNVLETKQLLKMMIEGCVELDWDTYTMLIEALCLDGKYGKALELPEMGEKGFVLNLSTCSAMARNFSPKDDTDTDEVCLVIKAMTRFGSISDSTAFLMY
ncbi:putative pentatricopeptide repeat-containing protein At1g09680 [Lycium barbarum]|uniref:putative pentatricopeptide repeat-containing protein At1g09680 n=1 Tax=Lycium barbarum TaxID=112863 RepID=UPI00293EF78E|nr:putative pentatricopeptide repeat-containing protein At1g09680 [Lycium barbarum]